MWLRAMNQFLGAACGSRAALWPPPRYTDNTDIESISVEDVSRNDCFVLVPLLIGG